MVAQRDPDPGADPPTGESALKRRALKYLALAFEEGRGSLSPGWVAVDPDLDPLRKPEDHDWLIIEQRYCSANADRSRQLNWSSLATTTPRLSGEPTALRGYPERPWGDPRRRQRWWAVVATFCVAASVGSLLAIGWGDTWLLLLGAALGLFGVIAGMRSNFSAREAGRIGLERRLSWPNRPTDPKRPERRDDSTTQEP